MGFWGSDLTDAEATERAAEQARREAEEAEKAADRQRRFDLATRAGYRWAKWSDPVFPPFDCPTCGASVTLSGVERHIEWHASL
jgi:hypothetical protein